MKKKYSKIVAALLLAMIVGAESVFPAYAIQTSNSSQNTVQNKSQEVEIKTIGKNLITNPDFDTDLNGWETGNWTEGAGKVYRGTNNPGPSGSGHYGIDGYDTEPYIQQTVTIPETGTYYAKQYAAANTSNGKFQVIKNGETVVETTFINDGTYHEYILEFNANKDDKITVKSYIGDTRYQYLNGDDFYLGTNKNGEEIDIEVAEFDENGNLLANNDFTDDLKYWSTKNVITATNNPPKFDGVENDKYHWSVDPQETYLKRYIEIPETGNYLFSHWVAATGPNGKFGIKKIDGTLIEEQKIKNDGKYHKESIRFHANKGDQIEIYVLPDQEQGWTNGDYFYLGLDNKNIISNPGFENEANNWDNTNIVNNNLFAGKYVNSIDSTHSLSQEINVEKTGYYDFGVYINNTESNENEKIQFIKDEKVVNEIIVNQTDNYERIYVHDLELEAGNYTINFSGDNYLADEVELTLNAEETVFANITNFEVSGRINEQIIDKYNKTINLEYIYGDDLSAIEVENIEVSNGVTASVRKGDIIDLSKPYEIILTTQDKKEVVWTVNAYYSNRQISMTSSNKQLENFFNWAVDNLDQFVVTGQTGKIDDGRKEDAEYIPSYWAGYFNRTAFYSRDFVHQATGAQIAGLADENFNMFKTFAKGISENREWYTLWAFNFDGSPYWMDYKNDSAFVKEVPAQFELVEKAWNAYLWSGDERYINDPDLLNFYEKSVTDFVTVHDTQNPNGIAEGKGGLYSGLATYNERSSEWKEELEANDDFTIEAADGISCQYAAYVAYANILNARGETTKADEWYAKADELKTYFNDEWSRKSDYEGDPDEEEFVLELSSKGRQRTGFAMETNYFIPLKGIVEPGKRNDLALDMIIEGLGTGIGYDGAPANIESYTYIPEMLYMYNRVEQGWDWIQYIDSIKDDPHEMAFQGTNGDYPEVSFTAISNVVEGMMGVSPNAGNHFIATSPRLAAEIPDATVKYMNIGGQLLHLTHIGNTKSQLTNVSEEDITWEARFYGDYQYININGKYIKAKQKEINGELVSYVETTVKASETATAFATDEIESFEVIVETVKNGTVSVDKTSAKEGEIITVTATPDEGYVLKAITVDGKEIEGTTFVMKNQPVKVGAIFEKSEPLVFDVNINQVPNGIISVDKTSAKEGETITVTATPNEGYVLKAITVDGKEIEGTTFVMKKQSVEVSAIFEKDVQETGEKDDALQENGDSSVNEITLNQDSKKAVDTSDKTSIVSNLLVVSLTGLLILYMWKYSKNNKVKE